MKNMKTVKLEKEDSKVTRKLITKFGESIYNCPEVCSVAMRVEFRDGSAISFRRDEDKDEFDRIVEED